MWALLILLAGLTWAQSPVPEPIFPNDTQKPTTATAKEFLEVVCPGHVVLGKEFRCDVPCPKGTGFEKENFEWSFVGFIRGHFLSPTSVDVVLAMSGCEPHSLNVGGSILLTLEKGTWRMLWYKGGVTTLDCHRVLLKDRREMLVCWGQSGGQGYLGTEIYLEDLTNPAKVLMSGKDGMIFQAFDDTGTCGWDPLDDDKANPIKQDYVERVIFENTAEGTIKGLSVLGRSGTRPMTLTDVKACVAEQNPNKPHKGVDFTPTTKPYRVDFDFDGKSFQRRSGR